MRGYCVRFLVVAILAGIPRGASAAEARHAWKAHLHEAKLVREEQRTAGPGPVPAHFGDLSPQARLAYLLARYDVDPVRFDHFHPKLGPYLAMDERLRAAISQGCMGMGGLFANTPLTRYLHYRRDLNPKRFDHYHPALGALLAEDDRLRAIMAGCVAGELIPPTITAPQDTTAIGTPSPSAATGGGGITPSGGFVPSAVPEPGSLTLLIVGSVAAGSSRLTRWARSRRGAIS